MDKEKIKWYIFDLQYVVFFSLGTDYTFCLIRENPCNPCLKSQRT